jgi:hypothetical protein
MADLIFLECILYLYLYLLLLSTTLLFRRFRKTTPRFVLFVSFVKLGSDLKDFRYGILRGSFIELCHMKMRVK